MHGVAGLGQVHMYCLHQHALRQGVDGSLIDYSKNSYIVTCTCICINITPNICTMIVHDCIVHVHVQCNVKVLLSATVQCMYHTVR